MRWKTQPFGTLCDCVSKMKSISQSKQVRTRSTNCIQRKGGTVHCKCAVKSAMERKKLWSNGRQHMAQPEAGVVGSRGGRWLARVTILQQIRICRNPGIICKTLFVHRPKAGAQHLQECCGREIFVCLNVAFS